MYWLDLNDDWIGRQFELFTMLLELKQNSPESFFNISGTGGNWKKSPLPRTLIPRK
jgi:hypothetical protein